MVDVETLQRENALLQMQFARVVESNRTLTKQLARLNDRITELLAVAQRRQRKPAVEKPPSAPPEVTVETRQAFDERPKLPTKATPPERPKTRSKPTGHKPVPSHLEPEEHAFRPDRCTHCGSTALDAADLVVEEELHVVKEHQRRRGMRRRPLCHGCMLWHLGPMHIRGFTVLRETEATVS